jgi:hypothetical protein
VAPPDEQHRQLREPVDVLRRPTTYFADRDGFGFFSYQTMAGTSTVWWFGMYTAIA